MSTLIIGISGAARAGKNTVAEHIVAKYGALGVRQYALADALKEEIFDFLQDFNFAAQYNFVPEAGLPLIDATHVFSSREKVDFVDSVKPYLRSLLQTWGTEYRRARDESYWIDRLLERIVKEGPRVALITDVRFANELAVCHAAIKVEKIGQVEDAAVASHTSEREWRAYDFGPNVVRAAEGDLATLQRESERVFEDIIRRFRVH